MEEENETTKGHQWGDSWSKSLFLGQCVKEARFKDILFQLKFKNSSLFLIFPLFKTNLFGEE